MGAIPVYPFLHTRSKSDQGLQPTISLHTIQICLIISSLFNEGYADSGMLKNQTVNQVIRDYEDDNFVFTNVAQTYDNTLPGLALRRVVIATYINKPKESVSLCEKEENSFWNVQSFCPTLPKL